MKVGANDATELKALAQKLDIPFANLLWGYALEDLLLRVSGSPYRDHLWLKSDHLLGAAAYRRGEEGRLDFYYIENRKLPAPEKLIPGQTLTCALAEQMAQEVFAKENAQGIRWEMEASGEPGAVTLELAAHYKDMWVPLTAEIRTLADSDHRPDAKQIEAAAIPGKYIDCLIYSAESRVSRDLFEILEKLELIGDMGAYHRLLHSLETQPLSGRCLIEELEELAGGRPQVKTTRRLAQLAAYRNYAYMRRRWEKYGKRQQLELSWEKALDRILAFAEPIWEAFCGGEVFFADWMPELGRFM